MVLMFSRDETKTSLVISLHNMPLLQPNKSPMRDGRIQHHSINLIQQSPKEDAKDEMTSAMGYHISHQLRRSSLATLTSSTSSSSDQLTRSQHRSSDPLSRSQHSSSCSSNHIRVVPSFSLSKSTSFGLQQRSNQLNNEPDVDEDNIILPVDRLSISSRSHGSRLINKKFPDIYTRKPNDKKLRKTVSNPTDPFTIENVLFDMDTVLQIDSKDDKKPLLSWSAKNAIDVACTVVEDSLEDSFADDRNDLLEDIDNIDFPQDSNHIAATVKIINRDGDAPQQMGSYNPDETVHVQMDDNKQHRIMEQSPVAKKSPRKNLGVAHMRIARKLAPPLRR